MPAARQAAKASRRDRRRKALGRGALVRVRYSRRLSSALLKSDSMYVTWGAITMD
jgi:hypothetical protein